MKKFSILLMSLIVSLTSFAQSNYRVVDIEHHFGNRTMFDAAFLEAYGCTLDELPEDERALYYTTLDLGAGRIAAMDAAGVDFAQLSLSTPGAEAYGPMMGKQIAREANDSIAKAIAQYPDRIGGWMTLYPEDVEWSLQEIDRCANMGLYGWACLSNMQGKRLDDPKYWPIFKKLEALGMPVYLHPEFSKDEAIAEFGYCINGPTLGFTVDALTTFMRMMCRGLFDECPNLKIIMGHDGEGLPFFKDRINTAYRQGLDKVQSVICEYKHEPSYYVDHNLWITTSGNFSTEALRCCLDAMPEGHVMMSTDYPYEDFAGSVSFVRDNLKLTDAERKATLGKNAMTLGFGKTGADYSQLDNWLKMTTTAEQNVDVFYILPTCIMQGTNEVENFSEQDKLTAGAIYEQQAKLFEGFCNIYAPYYRQIPINVALAECQTADDMAEKVRSRAGKDDVFAALDYYFENLNNGRPFILASHSQGSAMMRPVLDTYMKEHPEYYGRMVACYALGMSLPLDWFEANDHLKRAEDATSTGVVIGWNTEGPEAKTPSLLIGSNDYVINPLSWKCDGEWVSEIYNLGSLIDGQVIPGYADAQIDLTRRALICTTDINYIDVPAFGDRSLHGGDWSLYWGNIQQNAKDRIAKYQEVTTSVNNVKQFNGQKDGKFINDEKIVIIKDGKMYNTAGQPIK